MINEKLTILDTLGICINWIGDSEQEYVNSINNLPFEEILNKLHAKEILPCTATMMVDERTMHHGEKLAGGASLALAECLAGYASKMLFCEKDQFPTGMQVSGNHVFPVPRGEKVTAKAEIVHKGTKTHVWNVDIFNESGRLISSVRVTNMLINTAC